MTGLLPPLREELRLFAAPRRENGAPAWTLQDPLRQKFFRIGWREFEILHRWNDGPVEALSRRITQETTLTIGVEEILQFKDFLLQESLLSTEGEESRQYLRQRLETDKPPFWRWLMKNYLFFRIPLFSPDRFLEKTLPVVRLLLKPGVGLALVLLSVLAIFLAIRQWDHFQNTFLYLTQWQGVAWFLCTLMVTKVCHELGHAYAAKYYGVRVPVMGVAFLVMWPVLYTDMTEGWKLTERRPRLMLAGAGILVELALAMIATLAWSFTPDGPLRSALFLQATTSLVATLLVNLSPFMRFDGYFLLADLWDMPNLQERAFALGRWSLRRALLGSPEPPPERFSPRRHGLLVVYGWLTWLYRLILFTTVALTVYHFFFKLLGLILFVVEIGWFIVYPVYKEMQVWWSLRNDLSWHGRPMFFFALVLLCCLGMVVPWHNRITMPALLQSGNQLAIHAPTPARIAQVLVTEGSPVAAGDLLFLLEAPSVMFQRDQALLQLRQWEEALKRQISVAALAEQAVITQQELDKVLTSYLGLEQQVARLRITAPLQGVVRELAVGLQPGRWLDERSRLALLVASATTAVDGYVGEEDLERIHVGQQGHFRADNPEMATLPMVVERVDSGGVGALSSPLLASLYGGPLAVDRDGQGRLMPRQAIYRVRFNVVGNPAPAQSWRGVAVVHGEGRSILGRVWQRVVGVFIRESGF